MNPKFRYILLFAKIFLVTLLIIQPYNFFCNLTSKCQAFYFSELIPKSEGKIEIEVLVESQNYIEDLLITTDQQSVKTVTGRKNTITYLVKNDSDRMIRFSPIFYVEPQVFETAIKRYQCSCSKTYKLKKGQETTLTLEFELTKEIEKNDISADKIKLGFKIRPY